MIIKWPENIECEIEGALRELPCSRPGKITNIDGIEINEALDDIFKRLPVLENEIENSEQNDEDRINNNGGTGKNGSPSGSNRAPVNTYPFGRPTSEVYDTAIFVYHEKQGVKAYIKLIKEVLKYAGKKITSSRVSSKIGTKAKTIIILTDIWKESMEDALTSKLAIPYFHKELCVHVMFLKENFCFQPNPKITELPYFMHNVWYGPKIDMCCYNNVLLPKNEYYDLITNEITYISSDYNVGISMSEIRFTNSCDLFTISAYNGRNRFYYEDRFINYLYNYCEKLFHSELFAHPETYSAYAEKIVKSLDKEYGRIVIDKSNDEIYIIKDKDYKAFIAEVILLLDTIRNHTNTVGQGKNYCEIRLCGTQLTGNIMTDEVVQKFNAAFRKLIAATIS